MTPAERRAAERSKVEQDQQAKQSQTQAKNKETEEDQRLEFEKEKLKQRRKEFKQKKKESKSVNKRMQQAQDFKQSEQERKLQNRKEKSERDKKAQAEKSVRTAERAVRNTTADMKKIKIGFDNVEKDDGLGTAFSKFGGNVTQVAKKTGQGAFGFAKRELKDRPALRRARRELDQLNKEPEKKKPKVGSVTIDRSSAKTDNEKVSQVKQKKVETKPQQKLLPGRKNPERKALPAARSAPERKALPAARSAPERKALPPARTGGEIAKKETTSSALTDNQRAAKRAQTTTSSDYASKADRIAAFKKKRAEQRAAGVKMREEFLQEVEKMKKEKVDKVINVMRGKNKIETMPKVSESKDWRDGYKPLEFETVDLIKPEPLKPSDWRKDIEEASAAWTRKAGKKKSGGLNEKGRKSYERENPGSDLKAPSKKVGNPRRKSFCARMKGMKKKLTSSKTANDPDSRINKSLRAWNC